MDGSHENRAGRFLVAKAVQMATGAGTPVSCSTKDLSTTGARLIVKDGWSVPEVFLLNIQDDLHRWCQVMWRSQREVGIKFVPIPKSFARTPI